MRRQKLSLSALFFFFSAKTVRHFYLLLWLLIFLSFFLSFSRTHSLSGSKARARKTNKSAMMSKKMCERILRVVSRDDKNCAEPKKNTRGLLFFVSLSLNSLLRRRTIWWESGWRFPLSLSVRVRRWWLKTNLHSLIWQSRVPNNPRFAMITWISEPKRPSARERRKPFAPGKKRERYKKIREARCYVLLSFARSFPTMMLKNVLRMPFVRIWCSKWLTAHYLLSRKAERTKIDRTTKRQNTARVKRNFQRTKILIFNHFFLYF